MTLICVLIEAVGRALIWFTPGPALVLVGAALSGLGYSVVYQGLGMEAIHRVSQQNRGLAMGAYPYMDLVRGH